MLFANSFIRILTVLVVVGCTPYFGHAKQHSVKEMIGQLQNKDTGLQELYDAAVNLGKLRAVEAVPALIAVLKHDAPGVRARAAQALGLIQDERAVEPLIILKDKRDFVRKSTAYALGRLGDKRAVEPLIATLKDEHNIARGYAAYSLGKIDPPNVAELLLPMLKDEDGFVIYFAARGLTKVALKYSSDKRLYDRIVDQLYKISNKLTLKLFLYDKQVNEPDYDSVEHAWQLASVAHPRFAQAFWKRTRDENEKIRNQARRGLERMKGRQIP